MAQFYQVIDQGENITEQTIYPNINQQSIRYLINPEEQQIQQPIIVSGGEQYMVVDNSDQQQTITFQNPQFDLQAGQQQIIYMEAEENGQNIETIQQPIVLNHTHPLINETSQKVIMVHQAPPTMVVQPPLLVPRTLQASPQKQLQQSQVTRMVPTQQPNLVARSAGTTGQIRQIKNAVGRTQNRPMHGDAIRANTGLLRGGMPSRPQARNPIRGGVIQNNPRPSLPEPAQRGIRQPVARSRVQNRPSINSQIIEENGSVEAVALEDGRVISIADYNKLLAEKKKAELSAINTASSTTNMKPAVSKTINKSPIRRAPAKTTAQRGHGGINSPHLNLIQQKQQLQKLPPPPPTNINMINPSARPQILKIIESQNQANTKLPSVLRNFVAPPEIKEIISKTKDAAEFQDSIRMFVILVSGEQRLITFTIPKDECTIHDILEQVGVPLQPDTKIAISESDRDGINLVVSVGFVDEEENEEIEPEEPPTPNTPAQIPEQPKPPTPELVAPEPELPKFIPGKLAVCTHCGFLSDDFNKCIRCKNKFPDDIKAVSSSQQLTLSARKIDPKVNKIAINLKNNGATKNTPVKRKPKPKLVDSEPVILTLSSDEEEDEQEVTNKTVELLKTKETESILKEPSLSDIRDSCNASRDAKDDVIGTSNTSISIYCRTIRIGSYRFTPPENVTINNKELILKVPLLNNTKEFVTLHIERKAVVKVLCSFQKMLPVIFYYLTPDIAEVIRNNLGMKENEEFYFDPLSDEEAYKRVTLLPEIISEEDRCAMKIIYGIPFNVIDELSNKEANSILIRTCPKEVAKPVQVPIANIDMSGVKQLLIYPPGKGGLSINTEDYLCLAQNQFLNDVIIDFYLKHLILNLPKEQQEKVHVFSTFFYKRLTTKPAKPTRRSHPTELDQNLTPAEKRHARVKNWTKHVNLFDKDFIIVPINENAHWFLAIICFPNMNGPHTFDGKPHKVEPVEKKKKVSTPATIGNVTITPIKTEKAEQICDDGDLSDKDEAEGDESELESSGESEEPVAPVTTSKTGRQPIQQPCILIFDSLAGAGRSRVIATLRDYLTCEYKAKQLTIKVYNKDVIKGACPKVPQQTNYTDCGLYLLQYVESFLKDPINDYSIPINSLKTWFEEITVTKKREDISILIKKLMVSYNKDINILPNIILPTLNGEFAPPEDDEDEMDEDAAMEEEEEEDDEMLDHDLSDEFNPIGSSEDFPSPTKSSSDDQPENFQDELINDMATKTENPNTKLNNRDSTMSYLKSKRIARHRLNEVVTIKKFKPSND